jgi:PBSX family phage terminase large subunit
MKGKALPHQYKLIYSEAQFPALVAGFGSGKSEGLILRCLRQKFLYQKQNSAYYLPTYDLVKQIAFPRFEEILGKAGIKYKLNKSDAVLDIEGKGRVIFRTMDKPERIIGYEVADSFLDELDTLPSDKAREVWVKAIARNRQKKPDGKHNTMAVGTTPEGFRFAYQRWQQEAGTGYELIRARTYDNPFLPDGYISSLEEQYPPNLLQAYLNGQFVNLTSGTVYGYFDREKHHTEATAQNGEVLHIGQDFNVGGCVSTIHVIRDGIVYRVDEIESNNTFDVPNNVAKKYQGHRIVCYPDASGRSGKSNATRSDIQILRDAGWMIEAPNKNGSVIDRVNAWNGLLSHGRYLINTHNCPKGTQALEQQAWDKNGDPEKFNGPGTVDDYNDSAGYFVVRKFPLTKTVVRSVPHKMY